MSGEAGSLPSLRDQVAILTVALEAVHRFNSMGLTAAPDPDYDRARLEAASLAGTALQLVKRTTRS